MNPQHLLCRSSALLLLSYTGLVLKVGVEPTVPFPAQVLNLLRMPVPPLEHCETYGIRTRVD